MDPVVFLIFHYIIYKSVLLSYISILTAMTRRNISLEAPKSQDNHLAGMSLKEQVCRVLEVPVDRD